MKVDTTELNRTAREFFAALQNFADEADEDVEGLITVINGYIEEMLDDVQEK